ncbi:MAG: PP2C family protein-serine/threonine phosphatase [Acetobacteraceae bacterium]
MSGTARFRSWATTHAGARRTHNEDALLNRPDLGLWAVSDGAGGHEAGEVASAEIVQQLESIPTGLGAPEMLAEIRLRVGAAHTALRAEAGRRGPDAIVAATVVILVVRGQHFACLWAGDSRAYLLRAGVLRQVTRDHSLVQELLESGAISAEEAEDHPRANVITRAIGVAVDEVDLDKVTDRLQVGDRFLLCSDGLNKTLADAELATLLNGGEDPSERLIEAALMQLVTDNVTAVVIHVTG